MALRVRQEAYHLTEVYFLGITASFPLFEEGLHMVWGRFDGIWRHFDGIFGGGGGGGGVITVSSGACHSTEDHFAGSGACFPSWESNLDVFYAGFDGF